MTRLLKVFVYGTLKPNQSNYIAYCQGHVIAQQEAYTLGNLYYLQSLGYPAMTEGTGRVYGYLLYFEKWELLEQLDELEDYRPDRPEQANEYQRRLAKVYISQADQTEEAWTYFMDPDKILHYHGTLLESGYFNRA